MFSSPFSGFCVCVCGGEQEAQKEIGDGRGYQYQEMARRHPVPGATLLLMSQKKHG